MSSSKESGEADSDGKKMGEKEQEEDRVSDMWALLTG